MSRVPDEVGDFKLVQAPADAQWRWPVYCGGKGPPVLVLHELVGLTDELLHFAQRVVGGGFSAWLPVLAGPVPSDSRLDNVRAAVRLCVSREIHILATRKTSPVAEPLRALARHAMKVTGSRGTGVIGMCFSGGFALALAAEEPVLAAVAAQPSLPFATRLTPWCAPALGLSKEHIDDLHTRLGAGEVEVYVTRFSADSLSPQQRLASLRKQLGSARGPGARLTIVDG